MKSDARDIVGMPFEGEDSAWVGGFDVVELDRVVASGGEIAFVGRNAEAIYLGIGVRNCARANA
jgi:hypothetical protein